jgi:hypothetical protein
MLIRAFGLALLAAAMPSAAAQDDPLAGRPAFSAPEQPARSPASCSEIRPMSSGLPLQTTRIDLSTTGVLTAVQTDGALWYLVMCSAPDVRVMCVTYASNDMKPGERVTFRGGYNRVDPDHAVLDPCLASRPDDAPAPERRR